MKTTCWSSNRASEWEEGDFFCKTKKGFKWLWKWNVCWYQTGWSEYFKNCWSNVTGIFRTTISRVYRECSEKEKISSERQLCGQNCIVDVRVRMGRLVWDDRKPTATQLTTRYNQGIQNTISECTTCRTLKQMGYSSWRPHRVPLLSSKNRKMEATIRTGSPKIGQ